MNPGAHAQAVARLLDRMGIAPGEEDLFRLALTHRSWTNEASAPPRAGDRAANERLEFLGDAVLGLVIARRVYEILPDSDEGDLSKAKARLVSAPVLARYARRLRLGEALLLGRGEKASGGRERDSILANALEAVMGALFLAGGLPAVERVVLEVWREELERSSGRPGETDYKSVLQEYCQQRLGDLPSYPVRKISGPDHHRSYEVAAVIGGREYGRGRGPNKKLAAQEAAAHALQALQGHDRKPPKEEA